MRPDDDIAKISHTLAEAQTIATQRAWQSVSRAIDQAQTALLRIEPGDGEKPARSKYAPSDGLWTE